jgi:hypothetical protein
MTFKQAAAIVRSLGFTLVDDREYDEFIVKVAGTRADDEASYHTLGRTPDHLEDAVNTARAMHAHQAWQVMRLQIERDLAADRERRIMCG